MNRKIKFIDLGLMDYKEAWDFQQKLFDEIVEIKKKNRKDSTNKKTPNYFLFVEHPHVLFDKSLSIQELSKFPKDLYNNSILSPEPNNHAPVIT